MIFKLILFKTEKQDKRIKTETPFLEIGKGFLFDVFLY